MLLSHCLHRNSRICSVCGHCFDHFSNWVITHLFPLCLPPANFVCWQQCPVSSSPAAAVESAYLFSDQSISSPSISNRFASSNVHQLCYCVDTAIRCVLSPRSLESITQTHTFVCVSICSRSIPSVYLSVCGHWCLMHSCCLPMLSLQWRLFPCRLHWHVPFLFNCDCPCGQLFRKVVLSFLNGQFWHIEKVQFYCFCVHHQHSTVAQLLDFENNQHKTVHNFVFKCTQWSASVDNVRFNHRLQL